MVIPYDETKQPDIQQNATAERKRHFSFHGKALSPMNTSFKFACFEGILVGTMVYNKEEE